MHHRAAGKVEGPHLAQKADRGSTRAFDLVHRYRIEPVESPHHVCQGAVHKSNPQEAEQHEGPEADTLCQGPRDQRGCDDGEHALEHHMGVNRDIQAGKQLVGLDPLQEHQVRAPADYAVSPDRLPKSQGIADT